QFVAAQSPDAVQPVPVHELPFHLPPVQLVPAAASWAQLAPAQPAAKMSCSPLRVTPRPAMWKPPRASSSDPVPLAGTDRPFMASTVAASVAPSGRVGASANSSAA